MLRRLVSVLARHLIQPKPHLFTAGLTPRSHSHNTHLLGTLPPTNKGQCPTQWEMFETLEEAIAAYTTLKSEHDSLKAEKTALLSKRDELLGEVRKLKDKYSKFADYADQDLDIQSLLDIKNRYEQGDSEAKTKYESAYRADKEAFEKRLKAIEDERTAEREQAQKEREQATAARLQADAIAEFSKESHRIRNPQQFFQLFGSGKIQRGEDGKLFVGDEYKKQSLGEYIAAIEEDNENTHHFKPKGGSGSGTGVGVGGHGKAVTNPWKRDSFNLTEQGRILKANPELAKRLKAEAGGR